MAQDIRKMFREDRSLPADKLKEGHQKRFEDRLDQAFPEQEGQAKQSKPGNKHFLLKIAAILIVAIGTALYLFAPGTSSVPRQQVVETSTSAGDEEQPLKLPVEKEYGLSDVSPEFRKIENYYLASLNMELAKLEVNKENKVLVDSFMAQLAELDREYKKLNKEILTNGLDQSSVEAMIQNLQLRLELLYKLKNKIREINQSKNKDYENFQA